MANLDEIFAAMPAAAATTWEPLVIDPESRQIIVPDSEAVFGVEDDTQAETKHFESPRIVGDGVDLAACFVRVNYRNANGDMDSCLVDDLTTSGDLVTFTWTLTRKVTQYKGQVQFVVCACYPNAGGTMATEWHTTLATGTVLEGLEPDASTAEEETRDVIAQLVALVEKQTAAVEAEGAGQVAAVQAAAATATEEAKAAIQTQGAATLATIPEDYTALAAEVDALTRGKAPAIICEAEGRAIQVQDASSCHLAGLRLFGCSTQDGTPTPEAPVEIVSTPAPVVTVYGKNLIDCADITVENDSYYYHTIQTDFAPVIGQTYTLSMDMVCSVLPYHINIGCGTKGYNSDMSPKVSAQYEKNGRISITFKWVLTDEQITLGYTKLAVRVPRFANETEFSATMTKIMLELGEVPTDYEPYTAQPLSVTTPTGLPGIPVTSGGNYTDENGQQWICDEVDFAKGVYVQRIKTLAEDGTKTAVYKSTNGEDNYLYHFGLGSTYAVGNGACLCDKLTRKTTADIQGAGKTMGLLGVSTSPKYNVIYFNLGYYLTDNTVEAVKEYLLENPLTIYYAIATPIETPLSDAELAAFKALRTNKPTTALLNDAGAYMVAEYVADTKLYIDQKLAALVAANNT